MFAKSFGQGDNQVLVKVDTHPIIGVPEVRFYCTPPGFGVCSISETFRDDDEGWSDARAFFENVDEDIARARVARLVAAAPVPAPINMILFCPACGEQHIDEPKIYECTHPLCNCDGGCEAERHSWDNPPHRSHLCHACGHIWRPADVPTNGVASIETCGKADSPIVKPKRVQDAMRAARSALEDARPYLLPRAENLAGNAIALLDAAMRSKS